MESATRVTSFDRCWSEMAKGRRLFLSAESVSTIQIEDEGSDRSESVLILWARLRRWVHSLWGTFRPWTWHRKPPCQALNYYDITSGRKRVALLSCTCGIDWYRRPGFDETEILKAVETFRGRGH